jgi:hypothetical protein
MSTAACTQYWRHSLKCLILTPCKRTGTPAHITHYHVPRLHGLRRLLLRFLRVRNGGLFVEAADGTVHREHEDQVAHA